MSYNRRYKKRKVVAKKGTNKDFSQDKAIMSLKKKVAKLEHSEEVKYEDLFISATPVSTGLIYHCSGVAQGDDFNQRIGEQLTAKRASIKFELNQIAGVTSGTVRMIMLWDKQVNGVGPVAFTSTDPVEGILDNVSITTTMLTPYNRRTQNRYKILHDRVYSMEVQDATASIKRQYSIELPLSGASIDYGDSGGGVTSVTSRGLFLLVLSSATSTASLRFGLRLFFTDS